MHMVKIKITGLLLTLFISANVFAQSVEEGKRFLYYEKYNSAKDVLNKIVNANPNNMDAVYWLGQAYIGSDDVASAKALYQKTINANPNSPLLLVGMGHIELLENKTNDARNRFETAISLTKGKDANVLNAIGRANVDAKAGDAVYAIDKLKLAAERDKKNADIFANLGDAYRKMTDGSNAQLAYQDALAINPNYSRASFMIGRIYQTQGYAQEAIFLKYYNEAISKDPNYAPVYSWLANDYYYYRDINKAREYLDKYVALADADSKNCYYQAAFLYASGKNQETISKANECMAAAGANPYPNLYGLKAYAYDKMGDSLNAKNLFETYFQKQAVEKFGPNDYATYARVLLKFPGNQALAATNINKALAMDTLETDKIAHITSIASGYLAGNNYNEAGDWYVRLLTVKKNPTKNDIFNAGINYYKAGNAGNYSSYKSADSVFKLYKQKYPDDILGYYYGAIINSNIDSTSALGLAIPDYQKVMELAQRATDTVRGKQQMISGYNYMINYYYNVKKDKATAISYNDKILAIDPTNAQALANDKALKQPPVKVKVEDNKTKIKTPATKEKVKPEKKKVKGK